MMNTRTIFDPVSMPKLKDANGSVDYFDYAAGRWVRSPVQNYLYSQEYVDSMPEDGIISTAYQVKTKELDGSPFSRGIRPKPAYVAPNTPQYLERSAARELGVFHKIVNHEEVEGYVQAHYDADPDS